MHWQDVLDSKNADFDSTNDEFLVRSSGLFVGPASIRKLGRGRILDSATALNLMQRFKDISVVCECDKSTLERAAILARDNRAQLTIVYPIKEWPEESETLKVGQHSINLGKLVRQDVDERMKDIARSVESMGVRPATRLLIGDPFLEIIRDVIENERDLVIMTAEGKGGVRERLFGSTARHLMRKCPAPLLVMKPGRRKRFQQVLAAIDPAVTGGARDTLNHTILELGTSISVRDDANLHIVHAWTLTGESVLRGRAGVKSADIRRLVHDETERIRGSVESLLSQLSISGHRLHLHKGEAAEVIARLVPKLKIDLLVMGTVCRTGVPGFFIGNTAEQVLDTVDCSVLVVKPEGFVSPVAAQIVKEH